MSRRPSTTGIAFDVADASIPRNSASASIVVAPGVSTSSGASSRAGNTDGCGIAWATSMSAAKSPFSQMTSVFSPDPGGARKSTLNLPPMIPLSAWTSYASIPHRAKIFLYASRFSSKLTRTPSSSRSNEYASFMMNSRTRRRPPRGRGSSRSLTEKWYQSCGSCLYDWISRAWNVTVSSCVIGSTYSRPLRSVTWKTSGMPMRPVVSHSSAGVSTGMSISCAPIASISSRMICSTLRWTRQPSGMNVHTPALTWRT